MNTSPTKPTSGGRNAAAIGKCEEQDTGREEPRRIERRVHALLEEQMPNEVERASPLQGRGIEAHRLQLPPEEGTHHKQDTLDQGRSPGDRDLPASSRIAPGYQRVDDPMDNPHQQGACAEQQRVVEVPSASFQASGMVRATTNIPAIATARAARTRPTSARAWLPSQAYPDQDHHSSARTSRRWNTPSAVCVRATWRR